MLTEFRVAAFAVLTSSFIILPVQAQPPAAPLVPLPDSAQAAAPARGPESGPVVKLNTPTDSTPGITVGQARAEVGANAPEAGPRVKLPTPTDPAPGITVQQARSLAQASGPETGPAVKLETPTDSMPGITVQQARTRGILAPQNEPKVAVVPRP